MWLYHPFIIRLNTPTKFKPILGVENGDKAESAEH